MIAFKCLSQFPKLVIVTLSLSSAFAFAFDEPLPEGVKPAHVDQVMAQKGFEKSHWPYSEADNGCGSDALGGPSSIRDTWGDADFREACRNHDYCYQHGPEKQSCENQFLAQMRHACEVAYESFIPERKIQLLPCYGIARVYYAGVAAAGESSFVESREKQLQFEQLVLQSWQEIIDHARHFLFATVD